MSIETSCKPELRGFFYRSLQGIQRTVKRHAGLFIGMVWTMVILTDCVLGFQHGWSRSDWFHLGMGLVLGGTGLLGLWLDRRYYRRLARKPHEDQARRVWQERTPEKRAEIIEKMREQGASNGGS